MKKFALLLMAALLLLSLFGCSHILDGIMDDEDIVNDNPAIEPEESYEPKEPAAPAEPAKPEEDIILPEVGLEVGDLAPDFTVEMLGGGEATLSDLRGTPLFLNFWATWCGPCVGEMPHMQEVYDTYDNIDMLAVNVADDPSAVEDFIADAGYTFPVGIDYGEISELYQTNAIPSTFILDENGVIVFATVGSMEKDYMIESVENAIS